MKSLKYLYRIGHGPSSSHTMGPANACIEFKRKHEDAISYKAILYGSLALTGKGHLTDKVIIDTFAPKSCSVSFDYESACPVHPNTLDLIAVYPNEEIKSRYYSVGGGSVVEEGKEVLFEEDIYSLNSLKEIKEYLIKTNKTIVQYIEETEGLEIRDFLKDVYHQMVETIKKGLDSDGVLPGKLAVKRKAKEILDNKAIKDNKNLYAFAFATAEENASGNIVVTAPTCGSSGLLPSVLYSYQLENNIDDKKIVDSLCVAGLIGNIIKQNGSISGAEAGCQAEIGTACSMAAAAYTYLMGGNIDQIESAAEIALEHHLGLTCDPIDGYVQIPCIERNAVCAVRAIDAAKLVMFINPSQSKISFDLVVKTMLETGRAINVDYRETAKGGLAKEYKN